MRISIRIADAIALVYGEVIVLASMLKTKPVPPAFSLARFLGANRASVSEVARFAVVWVREKYSR
jgi:hypothetical protein